MAAEQAGLSQLALPAAAQAWENIAPSLHVRPRSGKMAAMQSAPDFRLYHSNSLEVLAGLLAEELRTPAPGQPVLAPDVILIPQPAMRRWLQATLAQAHGIAANLEFLTPGEFVQRALDANVPGRGEDLDASAMHWRLYAALTDAGMLREPAMRSLRIYMEGDDALKPWSLAGELASVFEKYQAWRRDWLLAWESGQGRVDPQAALWRRVAGCRAHRARRIDAYLARFGADQPATPAGLPSRLFAFAILNVSPDVLRVIATQARAGTLHFYLPTPTRKYWGDLSTLAERLRDNTWALDRDDDNPLLQAWGGAGRDFMAVLGGYEVVHPSGEIAAYADPEERADDHPERDTLLQRLQRDLLHRRPPPRTPWRKTPDRADNSVQWHACHTPLREVQVLQDQLRGLLEDPRFKPPLQPREIAVLAPDIDLYVPHIDAVFGGRAGRADFIPYALADASPLAAEPLADVFLRLLALPLSRFGLSEILDLLATPAIAGQAGLDDSSLEHLRDWLHDAGMRWGIDAAHRARHAAPHDDAFTWSFALDRLLLGYASGDDVDIAGVAPYPVVEGGTADALGALIRLLRVLARHEIAFASAMTPQQWAQRLFDLLDALLPDRPRAQEDERTLDRLRKSIDAFAQSAATAGFDAAVAPDVVRAYFRSVLSQADTRAPLLTGGVAFGRMVPMRLIPFRVICLLGMNDGDYPRRDPAGGLNKLTAELGSSARRYGDRSLRDDDRFLFLQLFAAAGEVFYLSWLGADPRDGSVREPSLLVSELLDVAARYHAETDDARDALPLWHPLQPFSPAAFGASPIDTAATDAHDPRRFSYRSEWWPAADAGNPNRAAIGAWIASPLPAMEPPEQDLPLAQLRGFLCDPAKAFLRQRMQVRLPDDADSAEDIEPLALPSRGLQRQQLQRAVFDACVGVDAVDLDTSDLHAALRSRALLPSGPLGRQQLDALLDDVRPFADAFGRWRSGVAQVRTFELDLDGTRLHGRIDELYSAGLARLRFDALNGPSQISHGLDWLVLCALGETRPLVQFAPGTAGLGPHLRDAIAPAQAHAALQALLTLRQWGLRAPLPFGARAGWCWYEAERNPSSRANARSPWDKARDEWHKPRGWSEGDTAQVRLALRGRDPFADAALGEEFRHVATTMFDAVVLGETDGVST
jgi:exodeoxyribonuclease V gamma subunit